jgi:hypothetical protein
MRLEYCSLYQTSLKFKFKVQFAVTHVNRSEKEKLFEVSRAHAAKIYDELKAGKTILEISRLGTGKETRYFVKPVK